MFEMDVSVNVTYTHTKHYIFEKFRNGEILKMSISERGAIEFYVLQLIHIPTTSTKWILERHTGKKVRQHDHIITKNELGHLRGHTRELTIS